MKKPGLLNVPTSLGASMRGAELGPNAIKTFLNLKKFKDFGEVRIESSCKDFTRKSKLLGFDLVEVNPKEINI